jgi:D-sedoheptulose 7-phosphate isomerase
MTNWIEQMVADEPSLAGCRSAVLKAQDLLQTCVANGRKILVCGNGGSAADSEHIVGELMKGFHLKRPVDAGFRHQLKQRFGDVSGEDLADHLQGAIPAISLVSQSALLTAFMNDVDGSMVFAQQVYGYGKPGDCLLALSTSGNSKNIIKAVQVAVARGVRTIGLTGENGGELATLCEVCIQVPSNSTPVVQQYHQRVYHALCAELEDHFFGSHLQGEV